VSGGVTVSEVFIGQLVVQSPPQPDFSVNAYPTSLLTSAGYSVTSSIEIFPVEPLTGNLTIFLSVELPVVTGLTAQLSPGSVVLSSTSFEGLSTLTLNSLATTPPGNYNVTIVGTGGIYTHAVSITLQILPPPVIVLNPASGAVGAKILVQGTGFPVQGETELLVTFDDQLVGFSFTGTGNFSFTFDVPVAQPGAHTVKVSDQFYTYSLNIITATAAFQVLPAPISLTVNLSSGTLYFPGDTASFYILVSQNGQPANITSLQLTVQVMKPSGAIQKLTPTRVGTGIYTASYPIPRSSSLGTYAIIVTAQVPATANTSTLTSFEVKPTWLQSNGMNIAAGTTVAGLVGLVGLAWQQGVFKRKRDDKSSDWNNWNGSSAKPQL
jgi:hypothetical protein